MIDIRPTYTVAVLVATTATELSLGDWVTDNARLEIKNRQLSHLQTDLGHNGESQSFSDAPRRTLNVDQQFLLPYRWITGECI